MTIVTKRNKEIINSEIKTLSELIKKRQEWLSAPNNKMRSTYTSVKLDTLEMEEKLNALKEEISIYEKSEM